MGRELWASRKERVLPHSPLPHARFDSVCKRWNLEHVVLDLFSHFTMGNIRWSPSAHVCVFVVSIDFLKRCCGVFFGWVTVCCVMVQARCLHLIVFLFLLGLGHSGRSSGFRHSGGRAATHQGSYAILEQRIGRHSHSTTAAASGRRHACGTAVPISPRTTRPRSTQRRHEVA